MKTFFSCRRAYGFTLPEVLTSLILTALIAGVLVSCFTVAMRVWRRCSSQSEAFPQAYLFVSRFQQEMKNAYSVAVPIIPNNPNIPDENEDFSARCVTFYPPNRDANGYNTLPLTQSNEEVIYYRSDGVNYKNASGVGIPGTYLWRRKRNVNDPNLNNASYTEISNSVKDVWFALDQKVGGRWHSSCTVWLSISGKQQSEVFTATFNTSAAVRNSDPAQ